MASEAQRPVLDVSGCKALVLGLGLSGLSSARWLAARGARVVVADTRSAPPCESALARDVPQARLVKGEIGDSLFAGSDLIVISPGLAKDRPAIARAVANGAELVGDVELFARALPAATTVLGITGSNGKSTVTALAGELLRAAGRRVVVAGNIGLPVLDALAQCERDGVWPEAFVVELSSYQLETTRSLRLAVATVLNVTENHLDRYPGLAQYAAAKARIFAHAPVQVLHRDDPWSAAMALPDRRVVTFGAAEPKAAGEWGLATRGAATWLSRFPAHGTPPSDANGRAEPCELIADVASLQLVGRHNALNALAALALVEAVGIEPGAAVCDALAAFRGLPHRMTPVAEKRGVAYIDDSKATTVAAAIAALDGLGRAAVLIAGGDGKGQDFTPLAAAVERHCRAVLLIGRDGPKIAEALAGCRVPVTSARTLEEAVRRAAREAQPGDVVLLSPACASLDMFRDFAHRGDAFAAAAMLINGEPVDA